MNYYKIQIQYDGSAYSGFQWQNNLKTVQSEINNALSAFITGKFTTMAASRTDTGVHALDQVVKISSENEIQLDHFPEQLNKNLPSDIRCRKIETCTGVFRPSSEAQSKEYRYFFTNKTHPDKAHQKYVANISNPLNLEDINFCLKQLTGEHNFFNFYSSGSNVKSTVRTIIYCDLKAINPREIISQSDLFLLPADLDQCYQLTFKASGFLKQMIRHIVSALWMVGSGKLTREQFLELLNGSRSDKQNWKVAPPNGLFLFQISY